MAQPHRAFTKAAEEEALALIQVLKAGQSSLEQIRSTIVPSRACTPAMVAFRKQVSLAFESFRIWRRGHAEVSPELHAEIIRLLRANLSLAKVASAVQVGGTRVWRVSRSVQASTWKRGRGRRFTSAQLEAIREAIKAGKPSLVIQREFACSFETVQKLRHALGDTRNHHFDRKLSPLQVQEIRDWLAQPRGSRSMTWRQVAARYGISIALIGFIKRHEHGY